MWLIIQFVNLPFIDNWPQCFFWSLENVWLLTTSYTDCAITAFLPLADILLVSSDHACWWGQGWPRPSPQQLAGTVTVNHLLSQTDWPCNWESCATQLHHCQIVGHSTVLRNCPETHWPPSHSNLCGYHGSPLFGIFFFFLSTNDACLYVSLSQDWLK